MNQQYGIIKYEMIMHWRRRALPFLLLIILLFGAMYGMRVLSGLGLASNVPFINVSSNREAVSSLLTNALIGIAPFVAAVPALWLLSWLCTRFGYCKA